jgi:HTH-type transcriptional regulator/antitoxin HigA
MSKAASKTRGKKRVGQRTARKSATDSAVINYASATASVAASIKARLIPMVSTERDYNRALAIAEDLITRRRRTKAEESYLDCLTTLIEAYEDKHHPINANDKEATEILKHLLEANGMNATDLGRLLGNRALGAKILSRERELNKAHIKVLAKRFSVNPGLFISC